MAHTPGPWKAGPFQVYKGEFNTMSFQEIADCKLEDRRQRDLPSHEINANIRLIAAAPELLAALREIHKLWCCPEPKKIKDWSARCDVMADYARKAIAKAEGK